MVIREEHSLERFALRHGLTALPITVDEDADGSLTYTVYGRLVQRVRRFEHECASPFDEASVRALCDIAEPLMRRCGYVLREDCGVLLKYSTSKPLPCCDGDFVILKTNSELARYESDTTLWRLELDDDDAADVICAVLENGRIVAFAGINDIGGDGIYEINVECAPHCRRRGYATRCVRGIAAYLFESAHAESVRYVCRAENTASVKTALSAGLEYIGRSLAIVYER